MDPFLNLPDEIIIKMCNEMEIRQLLNLSKSSSRVYQVCSQIIDNRKKEYQQKISDVEERVRSAFRGTSTLFHKLVAENIVSEIVIFPSTKNTILLIQHMEGGPSDVLLQIPWILPGTNFTQNSPRRRDLYLDLPQDDIIVKRLAKNLVDQGYIKMKLK